MKSNVTYTAQMKARDNGMRGFTLLELLVAFAAFAVLSAALFSLFRGAIRMRERTFERVENVLPRDYIAKIIKQDLSGILQPVDADYTFRRNLYMEAEMNGGVQQDRFDFYTTSGKVTEFAPWSDIQLVSYYLQEPENGSSGADGYDLVRESIQLPDDLVSTIQDPQIELLFDNIKSLDFSWFSGDSWEDNLDTELNPEEFPLGIRMHIEFMDPEGNEYRQPPLDIFAETLIVAPVLEEEMTEEETGGMG